MASPFPRLTTPHFFAPVKRFAFSLSGAKKRQLPRTLCASITIENLHNNLLIIGSKMSKINLNDMFDEINN